MTELDETIILIPGHQIDAAELPKMPLRTWNLLLDHGWIAKAGYSKFKNPTGEYGVKAQKAGQQHGGEEVENIWIDAVNPILQEKLTAVWHDGSFEHALIGVGLPRKVNSRELSKIIKGEEE